MREVLLDISRLISRVRHARPSGVDRVEMAYARGLAERYGDALRFCAVHPTGAYGRIAERAAQDYLDYLENRWEDPENTVGERSVASVLPWMRRLVPQRGRAGAQDRRAGTAPVLVQVSPHHLHQTAKTKRILAREGARFVCLVHDLIPIEYPEYARPGGAATHERRMETVSHLADAILANSQATADSFARWAGERGARLPPTHVALLGTQAVREASAHTRDQSYFVCLGTIEPRKNHLLLLHQWRRMAQTLSPDAIPRLKIIGRRGWENEQIVDLLDRSPAIARYVDEINNCSDEELAEGYGMPIAEALAAGTPVIASDIPAHREAGADAPDFLDPLAGPQWQEMILDFAQNGERRSAQMKRLQEWHPPQWREHLDIAQTVINQVEI